VTLVDSSVWIGYFNGQETPEVRRLDRALSIHEDLAVLDLIITEVLQGFRAERDFATARAVLIRLPRPAPGVATYVRAARLFRRLRARGITVRGAIDCIVAQACIELRAELLSADADFRHIAAHSRLRLAKIEGGP